MKIKSQPKGERPGIGRSLVILCAGIAIGIFAGYLLFSQLRNPKKPMAAKAATTVQQVSTSHFTSPISESDGYRKFDIRPVSKMNEAIENRVEELLQKGKAQAISVYYKDLTNNKVVGINEAELFSPASLLKVPVLITVLKYAEDFPTTLQQSLMYNGPSSANEYKDIHIDQKSVIITGRSYTIDQLLEIMIVASDNEATLLLLDYIDRVAPGFRQQVEADLKLYTNNIDYDQDFLTVKRYSSFFRVLYNASYLDKKMSEKALDILSKTGYGNGIRQAVPQSILVSHKYGHRQVNDKQHQYHHFAIIYHPYKPFLLGVMTKGPSEEKLQASIASIAQTVYLKVDSMAGKNGNYLSRDID